MRAAQLGLYKQVGDGSAVQAMFNCEKNLTSDYQKGLN
jgi:hypothetical protein